MPMVTCRGCGGTTNTATSVVDNRLEWGEAADRCFARWTGKTYEPGCAYETCSPEDREFADVIIQRDKRPQP